MDPLENKIVVLPYTNIPGVEHKFALTLYTDHEHVFEKIIPSLVQTPCVHCNNPEYMPRILHKLATLESKMKMLQEREIEIKTRQLQGGRSIMPLAPELRHQPQLVPDSSVGGEEENYVTAAELASYTQRVQKQAREQHDQYIAAVSAANEKNSALEAQIQRVREAMQSSWSMLTPAQQAQLTSRGSQAHTISASAGAGATTNQGG